ncbi:hypothetical protein EVAR_70194_1 [Eumeta japonica]|uniref:Uncharacterized protein n=1 Tax=Eumeta variegata TaxID=151549 RepID=A0A4C1SIE8_EUMVA|nr:hypothetical protein EVAR_70194_1 [Eumeta japonica]
MGRSAVDGASANGIAPTRLYCGLYYLSRSGAERAYLHGRPAVVQTGSIVFGIGSHVMLQTNTNVNRCFIDGAMGRLRELKQPTLSRERSEQELPSGVFVHFNYLSVETYARRLADRSFHPVLIQNLVRFNLTD